MGFSLIIPVYKNEENIVDLIAAVNKLHTSMSNKLKVVFVVDGSPDRSLDVIQAEANELTCPCTVVVHSRNFGSFAAMRTGMSVSENEYYGVMAADLQEPPSFMIDAYVALSDGIDIVVGKRQTRDDGMLADFASNTFWWIMKKFIIPDLPSGGVDIFACNRSFRDHLLQLDEQNSSLIGLIFWMGFKRYEIPYNRVRRTKGTTGWTLSRKIKYMLDSVFSFTDLPIRVMMGIGISFLTISTFFGTVLIALRISGAINQPGYAGIIITILLSSSINVLSIGIVGHYIWRTFENTKNRPNAIVSRVFDLNSR
jgi:glycosyltransferase involved in cell wall biosynthesis